LTKATIHEAAADRREAAFQRTRDLANKHGLPNYSAWRATLERRYTVMPTWYWDESRRRQNYTAHIQTTIEWQERQSRLNKGAHGFFGSLC